MGRSGSVIDRSPVVLGSLLVIAMLVLGTMYLMAWVVSGLTLLLLVCGPVVVAVTARKGRRAVVGLVVFVLALLANMGATWYTDELVRDGAVQAIQNGRGQFSVLWYDFKEGHYGKGRRRVFHAPNSFYFVVMHETDGNLRAELRD